MVHWLIKFFEKLNCLKLDKKGDFYFLHLVYLIYLWQQLNFFPLPNSIAKESKNTGAKKNHKIIVDAGLNALAKKIKKGISSMIGSGITLSNNERKDIIKVIKSFENRGILLKELVKKLIVKKEDS